MSTPELQVHLVTCTTPTIAALNTETNTNTVALNAETKSNEAKRAAS